MGHFYFARHGQTIWNVENKICGATDIELTELGHEQARKLGREILRQGLQIDEILYSPLIRAAETAAHISEMTGIPMRMEPRLQEQNFGKYESTARDGEEFRKAKADFICSYEGGESMLRLCQRIYNLLDDIKRESKDKTYLLVAHNGIARAVQSYFYEMTNEEFAAFGIKNCEIRKYEFEKGSVMSKNRQIIPLFREKWKGTVIPMRYTAMEYYDVEINRRESGFQVELERKRFAEPVNHYPEEYDFPDKLYQDHWEKAYAWGILRSKADGSIYAGNVCGEQPGPEEWEMVACIETCPEEWSNRLMVTELWVHEDYRRQGIAHELMAVAKEQARLERRRAIILETQSCNVGAITFYLKEGFSLIGFDSCCYNNRDLERKEVRLDLGILLNRRPKLKREEVEIRQETEADYDAAEEMTMHAFWNKHHRGCDEHLLVHKLRSAECYLPEFSRIAVKDGKVIGCIMYSRAWLKKGNETKEILTFGPLCVEPEWHGTGVGEMLLEETMKLAKEAGEPGIVIFGEPDYYPLRGFVTCDKLGITTANGGNSDAFMGCELIPGALKAFGGSFHESKVFEELPPEETEELSKKFPPLQKQFFPGQWD